MWQILAVTAVLFKYSKHIVLFKKFDTKHFHVPTMMLSTPFRGREQPDCDEDGVWAWI